MNYLNRKKYNYGKRMSGRPIRQLRWIGLLLGLMLVFAAVFTIFPPVGFDFWKILGSFLSASPMFDPASGYRFGRLVAYLLGTIFFSGVVVATLTNIIRTAGERFNNGTARYKFRNHVLFLGYDELMIGTLRQEMDSNKENDFVVAVPDDVAAVRSTLYQHISTDQCCRLIVIRASRVNVDDLKKVAQTLFAKKIFIIGQPHEDTHDANNLKCLGLVAALASGQQTDPIPCMYYLRNQSTFYLVHRMKFEAENFKKDILLAHLPYNKANIEKHINAAEPFNFHESIARHLLFGSLRHNEATLRLDTAQGNPHLIIYGMTLMGLALMRDVLMTQHFPSHRLRITMVDSNAREELHYLIGRHRPLFDNCHYSFRDFNDPTQDYDHPARLDFLDTDIEFIQCDIAHPRLSEYLRQSVSPSTPEVSPTVTAIAICTDNSPQNMALAIYMPREVFQAKIPIWVYQTGCNSMTAFVENDASNNLYSCIHVFSTLDYGVANRRQSSQWLLAKAVADNYAGILSDQTPDYHWTLSLPKDRWSSLYAALSKIPMLRSFGKENIPIRLSDDEKKLLSVAEHNRWITEKLLNGWEPAPPGTPKDLFSHDKIVSYSQLDDESKAKDIQQIVAVVEALNRTSRDIVPPPPCPESPIASSPISDSSASLNTEHFTQNELPDDLLPLVERMAENVHIQWMQNRLDQGWTYGSERNDTLKTHPCLIPYADLPEEEKNYDRATSLETLRFVLSQGFVITKKNATEL